MNFWAGEKPARTAPVVLTPGAVVAGMVRDLIRRAAWIARLGWPTLLAGVAVVLADVHLLRAPAARAAVPLAVIPFAVMLLVAWQRLLLLGPAQVTAPPLRWTARHTRFLALGLGVALVHAVLFAVLVVAVAGLPMTMQARGIGFVAALWFVVTLFTPLTLKLPAVASGIPMPARTWQARPAHFGNAALVWALVIVAGAVLLVGAGALIARVELHPALYAAAALGGTVLALLAVLLAATAQSVIFRILANAPPPQTE